MISDVLFEAIEDIERYRSEFDCYPTHWPQMDRLLREMDAMRQWLDTPPSPPISVSRSMKQKLLAVCCAAIGFSKKDLEHH